METPVVYSLPLRANNVLCSFNTIQPSGFTAAASNSFVRFVVDLLHNLTGTSGV